MATASSNSEVKAETILELAKELLQHLQNNIHEGMISMSDAFHSLDEHLCHLPLLTAPPITIRRQLAAHGARLWNISAHMIPIIGNITHLSAIALFMLDRAAPSHGSGSQRVLEAAMKTGQSCTEHGLIELSQKIIEIVAVRLDRLDRSADSSDKAQITSATVGYYMVRVHLAWLQGRPDIADHLFSKIPAIATAYGQRRIFELCYKIGSFALDDRQYDNAAKWLERALSAWELYHSHMAQSIDNDELLILHASIRANLQLESSLAKDRLQKALNLIKKRYPHEFAVKALQLEILGREGHWNGNAYLQILRDMLDILNPNEAELKTLVFYLQKVRDHETNFYVQGLQQLLAEKLATSNQQEWTERIFIHLVWTLTNSRLPMPNSSSILRDTMKRISKCGRALLSEDATNACLILIWKYVDVVSSEGNLRVAEHWCSVVLEEVMFQLSSENKTIFIKRYIECASDNLNVCAAYKLLDNMADEYRKCPSALYLIYKAALSNKDFTQGHFYLDSLFQLGATGRTYLLPCAAEALRSGQTLLAAKCVQHVVDNLHNSFLEGKYIASLFIAAGCLVSARIGNTGTVEENDGLLAQVIRVLEAAHKSEQNTVFSAIELEWLSQRSYNIAVQARSCDSRLVIWLLDLSMQFTDLQRKTMTSEKQSGLRQHYLHCDSIKIFRIITEARKEMEPFWKALLVLRTSTSPYLDGATARGVLPRYIHTFFQLSLDASEYCLAESALDQALASACDLYGTTMHYPSDEIQWMATMSFNRAVDLYLLSESDDCQRWAEKAIKLADLGEKDCALLGKLLRENLQKLS
ncbi:meiosis protein SPO22/ZIP4 like-domain-containing protein [Aspergillus pseudocaelatus]|uniref:Meiosis protein SPO22/ZIP4 like-domain-containing protein n=1 Tax=Aspergillus pseudocaelatus TaxID=1825620 RepID=A0ABQ6WJK7_9EURO|nr:meiosis protein SPO22/ZIP4 like-domain-containing protein [Aspergillus pseudocaelatus]